METHIADIAANAGLWLSPVALAVAALGWLALVSGFAARVAESIDSVNPGRISRSAHHPTKESKAMNPSSNVGQNRDAAVTDQESTMKAIVQHEFGSADVLELQEIDKPEIKADEVLVRVQAAGVDPGVWHLMTGLPYLVRMAGFGMRAPKQPVPGVDVAGVVEAVGVDVKRFQPGDEVFGSGDGAFAEYATAKEGRLALKPANLTFEQAATVAVSGFTALQGLRDKGEVQPGDRVLIIGASGGVGTFAVQIAKSMGADVTGVTSTRNLDMVRSIGADHVIDYTREDITDAGLTYDVILDTAGNRSLSLLRRALTAKGTLVIVGAEGGGKWIGAVGRTIRALLISPFVGQRLRAFISNQNNEDLIALRDLIESGDLAPVIDKTYELAETADAIRYIAEGHARGKVVVAV